MAWNSSIVCKKIVITGLDDFKVIQEIHMGLGSISSQRENDLDMKYGQNGKKEIAISKKAQNLGIQSSK